MCSTILLFLCILSFISQYKFELALFHLGLCHIDAYGVTKLILVMMATANETVVLLVKVVVVVVEVAHLHHALAVVLVNLAVYTIALYATDVGIKLLSYKLTPIFHHFIFNGVALCILGNEFLVTAMLT